MTNTHTAALVKSIAQSIIANCDAYHAGAKDRATWDAEQLRLWNLAGHHLVASKVMQAVCPPLRIGQC